MINWILWRFLSFWAFILGQRAYRTIVVGGGPYLTRLFLLRGFRPFGMFIHYFHKGDQGRDFHNHPWKWAYSLILSGGYSEERINPETGGVSRHEVRAWTINKLTDKDWHRVDLNNGGCWTLFIRGPRTQSWGFLNRETLSYSDMLSDETTND